MVMAVVAVVESTMGDVSFVPTLTEVPFKAVVVCPVVPIVIGVTPTELDPILIAPVVRVPVVALAPIYNAPVV